MYVHLNLAPKREVKIKAFAYVQRLRKFIFHSLFLFLFIKFIFLYIKTLLKDPEGRVDIHGVMATEMDQTCQQIC